MGKPRYRKSMDKFSKMLVPTVYNDVPTFLGVPAAKLKGDLVGATAAVLGVPFQTAQSLVGREIGINMLDSARLRKASLKYGSYLPELDIDIFEHLKLVDYGDVTGVFPMTSEELPRHLELTKKKISEILEVGCIPIVIGAFPYAIAKAMDERKNGKIGILHLDAHGDNLEEHENSKWSAACWVARTSELKNVNMKNFVQVGMRGPRNFKEQVNWYRDKGSALYTYMDIKKKGIKKVVSEAIRVAQRGTNNLFLNIDFDVLDLGSAPGLDEPLGITTAELLEFVHEVGRSKIKAFNIEWIPTPAWEPYQLPAWPLYWIATWTILYLLAGVASKKV